MSQQPSSAVAHDGGTAAPADIHLSVVIPAYNEEQRITGPLQEVVKYLLAQPYTSEIVVVDDGSADRTGELARDLCNRALTGNAKVRCRVLRNEPNRGKGYSIKRGMLEAVGNYRLFSDADLSTPIEELEKFWPAVESGSDVVIGSRALRESKLIVRQRFYREWMGRIFNLLVRMMLVPGIHDTQCGFKLFSGRAARVIFPAQTLEGFAFDVELLVLARKNGFRTSEIAVRWINSPASKVSAIRDSLRMFLDLLRLKLRK